MESLYGEDLAHVHDTGFSALAASAGATLRGLLHRAGHRTGTVVDLGCGAGTTLRVLADAGFDPVGVDLSAALLDRARARVPGGVFLRAPLQDAPVPPCVGIAAVGEVLSYVSAGMAAADDLAGLATRLRAALAPGGVLLLDVATPGREPEGHRTARHSGDGWALEMHVRERDGVLTRDIDVERRTAEGVRRLRERHVLRLLDADAVAEGLSAAGFRVERLPGHPGVPPIPGLAVFVAG